MPSAPKTVRRYGLTVFSGSDRNGGPPSVQTLKNCQRTKKFNCILFNNVSQELRFIINDFAAAPKAQRAGFAREENPRLVALANGIAGKFDIFLINPSMMAVIAAY